MSHPETLTDFLRKVECAANPIKDQIFGCPDDRVRHRTDELASRGHPETIGDRTHDIGSSMTNIKRFAGSTFLLGLIGLVAGCLVGPREGYYDGNHHRYYHANGWHDCAERDEHCR